MTRLAIALSLLFAAGCQDAGGPTPDPASSGAARDAAPRTVAVVEPAAGPAELPETNADEPAVEPETPPAALLLWGHDADGGAYTWWLEPDGHGAWDVVEAEGVYLSDGEALWHWRTETEDLPLGMDCSLFDQGDQPPFGDTGRAGTGVRAVLEQVGGDATVTVMTPDRDAAFDAVDYEERVWLEGSVGPVLFVHRAAWDYACGAHGGEAHSFLAFDVVRGEASALYGADTRTDVADRLRDEAWAVMQQDLPFAEGPADLTLTAHRPTFDEDGRLALEHQLTAGTCYACSDGDWDSYTTSAYVRDAALPEALAPHADYPAGAVRWLREQVDDLDVRGVSRPDPSLRPLFEDRQAPGC